MGREAALSARILEPAYRAGSPSARSIPYPCVVGCAGPPTLKFMNGSVHGIQGPPPIALFSTFILEDAETFSISPTGELLGWLSGQRCGTRALAPVFTQLP